MKMVNCFESVLKVNFILLVYQSYFDKAKVRNNQEVSKDISKAL